MLNIRLRFFRLGSVSAEFKLGGSWSAITGVISKITTVRAHIGGRITPTYNFL